MSHFDVPASDYMSSPVLSIGSASSCTEAEALIEQHEVTALGVTDASGKLVGVLSRTDLLRAASGESGATFSIPDLPVADVMTPDPEVVADTTTLAEIAKVMLKRRFHRVFVGAGGAATGVVSTRDIMRAVHDKRVKTPAIEIATRKVFKVRSSDTVSLAVERLDATNRHGLIVTEDDWPVGTFSQLDALLARARDPRTLVDEVMELRMLALPHEIPLFRAARQALAMNVRRFVLVDERAIVGVVSSFDFLRVMT